MLVWQPDSLPQSLYSRITTKYGELWGIEGPAYAHRTEISHAVQSRQGAILVA